MVHTLKIGGKTRKVLCGNYAFKKLKDEEGLTLGMVSEAMQTGDATIIPHILYYSLRAAELYEKAEAEDYDTDTVCLWMDAERGVAAKVLPWITEAIMDISGAAAEEKADEGEAKKKTPTPTSIGQA